MVLNNRLLEADMKACLIDHLKKKDAICRENSVIINELTIDDFSGRVDLVTADDKGLYAYEIKSEADSLCRLENQVARYLRFFDKITVFATPKHISGILKIVPPAVAVWVVEDGVVKIVQRGKKQSNQEIPELLKLMKVSELRQLVSCLGKTPEIVRRSLLEALLCDVSRAKIRAAVLKALKNRYRKSSAHFWGNVGDTVKARDIVELSPYLTEKKRIESLEAEQKEFWKRWSEEACSYFDDPFLHRLNNENNNALFGDVPSNIQEKLG